MLHRYKVTADRSQDSALSKANPAAGPALKLRQPVLKSDLLDRATPASSPDCSDGVPTVPESPAAVCSDTTSVSGIFAHFCSQRSRRARSITLAKLSRSPSWCQRPSFRGCCNARKACRRLLQSRDEGRWNLRKRRALLEEGDKALLNTSLHLAAARSFPS